MPIVVGRSSSGIVSVELAVLLGVDWVVLDGGVLLLELGWQRWRPRVIVIVRRKRAGLSWSLIVAHDLLLSLSSLSTSLSTLHCSNSVIVGSRGGKRVQILSRDVSESSTL
jgi:hypothetical protein